MFVRLFIYQVMVKSLEKELSLLKKELLMHDTLANRSQVNYGPLNEQQRKDIHQQVQTYLQGSSDEIEVSMLDHFKLRMMKFNPSE